MPRTPRTPLQRKEDCLRGLEDWLDDTKGTALSDADFVDILEQAKRRIDACIDFMREEAHY